MSEWMTKDHFKAIKKVMPLLWADEKLFAEGDPWWKFRRAIELYNKNRSEKVWSSRIKTLDESMSAYRPQTKRTGNLLHLSKVTKKKRNNENRKESSKG